MHSISVLLSDLFVSPLNVRKALNTGHDDSGIAELADSISVQGLITPITVRPTSDGKYEIVAGQRRFLACKTLNWETIQYIVRDDLNDSDAMTLSLVENVQRSDMDPMDEARAYKELYDIYGSYDRVAKTVGLSSGTISGRISLLKLPTVLQDRLSSSNGGMSIGTMTRLANTFSGDDAVYAYNKISGFNGTIAKEALKQSNGDLGILDDVVKEIQEGAFDMRRCGGLHGCEVVRDLITQQMTKAEFENMVQKASCQELGKDHEYEKVKEAAWAFWKVLASGNADEDR